MKVSFYKSYDELPLFLNSKIRAPGKTQRSGFAGERRSSGMSEPCRFWSRTTESTHGSCIQKHRQEFFSLPNELFFLNTGHGAITVYAYLLYCEDRRTHQCHPSYRTISAAVHLTVSTVMKHITKLADRQFITTENTSYIDRHGMKQNGNNLYTILPIQMAMDHCYQQQMLRLEKQALIHQQARNTPCAPL